MQFILPTTGRPMPWIVKMPEGKEVDYTFRSRFRLLDDAFGCVSWGHAGGGLFQTYHFIAGPAVARGELVEVLQAYGGRSRQFSVTYPQNRHLSARVRAFVDFMLERLRSPA
jgi:DNA-binding transcriptional LysR family regulator